ncbi:DUF6286 domain-containing protein [Streptomyces lasiicapitis]|uniref:DUF6286 domain-containing Asp23/Gls24 family envelope stress response protein n=1 Tax=Streptomyces lasiicapitis TaxID=1923961 RepID=UPI0033332005
MNTPAGERGATTIADRAVRRIAERAATEALGTGEVRVGRGSAAVRGRRARVGVTVTVPYPGVLDDTGESVRSHVTERTARLTGLSVDPARVHVRELALQELSAQGLSTERLSTEGHGSGGKAASTEAAVSHGGRRPWSERRLPVAVLALAAAVASGVLLFDVVAVHAAEEPPARWRVRLLDWLATHGPDGGSALNLAVAAAVFALGVWLLVLAVAPGQRRRLPMAPPLPGVRAVLERGTAAALLRDAVAEVPGVRRVGVRVGRRRARVRVGLEFGDPVTARQEVREAVEATVAEFGLTRPPRLRIRLRTEPSWRAPAAPTPPPAETEAAARPAETEAPSPPQESPPRSTP